MPNLGSRVAVQGFRVHSRAQVAVSVKATGTSENRACLESPAEMLAAQKSSRTPAYSYNMLQLRQA